MGEREGEGGARSGSGEGSCSGSGEGSGVGSAAHAFKSIPGPLCHWGRFEAAALSWGSSSRGGGDGVVSSCSARESLVSSGKLEACCGEATGESGAEAMTSGEAIGGVSGAWGEDIAMEGDLTASWAGDCTGGEDSVGGDDWAWQGASVGGL